MHTAKLPLDQISVSGLTRSDLVQPDLDVVVPVGARLLMVEAQSVEELVLHDSLGVAPRPDGQVLSGPEVSHERPTPIRGQRAC